MALNLSDGQLTTSSATLVTFDSTSYYLVIKLFNTSVADVDVTLTVTRTTNGTARTLARAELKSYESLYLTGVSLDQADTLAGYASRASAIDYMVSRDDRGEANFSIMCRAADGSPKMTTTVTVEVPVKSGPDAGEMEIIKRLERLEAVAMRIA